MRTFNTRFFYNIMRKRTVNPQDNILLYELPQFENRFTFEKLMSSEYTCSIYKSLLPILISNRFAAKPPRNFVTKLEYNPPAQSLLATVLKVEGQVTMDLDINNVIPIIYGDQQVIQRLPHTRQPFFIDTEMIYFNTFLKQVFLFHKQGVWDENNVNHPDLSLEKRFNEKKWFDEYTYM